MQGGGESVRVFEATTSSFFICVQFLLYFLISLQYQNENICHSKHENVSFLAVLPDLFSREGNTVCNSQNFCSCFLFHTVSSVKRVYLAYGIKILFQGYHDLEMRER